MSGKELIVKQLDLLVEMAEYCDSVEKTDKNKSKCINCKMNWNFGLSNHGCILVEIMNNDKFLNDLESVCEYQGIEYRSKLNRVTEIFVTECE